MNKFRLLILLGVLFISCGISAQSIQERANKIYKNSSQQVNKAYKQSQEQFNRSADKAWENANRTYTKSKKTIQNEYNNQLRNENKGILKFGNIKSIDHYIFRYEI